MVVIQLEMVELKGEELKEEFLDIAWSNCQFLFMNENFVALVWEPCLPFDPYEAIVWLPLFRIVGLLLI